MNPLHNNEVCFILKRSKQVVIDLPTFMCYVFSCLWITGCVLFYVVMWHPNACLNFPHSDIVNNSLGRFGVLQLVSEQVGPSGQVIES